MLAKLLVVMILIFSSAPWLAQAECSGDQNVTAYLEEHPGWKPVAMSDLASDDRALWQRYHRGLCPGIAAVNFGDGGKSWVLALLSQSRGKMQEELVAVKQMGSKQSEQVLSPAIEADRISVVWRAEPGKSHDYATGRTVLVPHDSAIYEVMESGALQFYWTHGGFRTLQTAD